MQINGISSECVTIPLFHWPTESDRGAVAGKNFCTKIVLQCFAKFCLCIHEFAGFAQPMRGGAGPSRNTLELDIDEAYTFFY